MAVHLYPRADVASGMSVASYQCKNRANACKHPQDRTAEAKIREKRKNQGSSKKTKPSGHSELLAEAQKRGRECKDQMLSVGKR